MTAASIASIKAENETEMDTVADTTDTLRPKRSVMEAIFKVCEQGTLKEFANIVVLSDSPESINFDWQNKKYYNMTFLMAACWARNLDIIEYLIKNDALGRKANPALTENRGWTALLYFLDSVEKNPVDLKSKKENEKAKEKNVKPKEDSQRYLEVLDLLLQFSFSNMKNKKSHASASAASAASACPASSSSSSISSSVNMYDINLPCKDGTSYLLKAASNRGAKVVRKILEAGADVNARGLKNVTAAMLAAEEGQVESLEALKEYEADFSLTDADGKTVYDYAKKNQVVLNWLAENAKNTKKITKKRDDMETEADTAAADDLENDLHHSIDSSLTNLSKENGESNMPAKETGRKLTRDEILENLKALFNPSSETGRYLVNDIKQFRVYFSTRCKESWFDINIQNPKNNNRTLLMEMVLHGSISNLDFLLNRVMGDGSKRKREEEHAEKFSKVLTKLENEGLNLKDSDGNTALHLAVIEACKNRSSSSSANDSLNKEFKDKLEKMLPKIHLFIPVAAERQALLTLAVGHEDVLELLSKHINADIQSSHGSSTSSAATSNASTSSAATSSVSMLDEEPDAASAISPKSTSSTDSETGEDIMKDKITNDSHSTAASSSSASAAMPTSTATQPKKESRSARSKKIHDAATKDVTIFNDAIEREEDLNIRGDKARTPLMTAIYVRNLALVKVLLCYETFDGRKKLGKLLKENKRAVKLSSIDEDLNTALHHAVITACEYKISDKIHSKERNVSVHILNDLLNRILSRRPELLDSENKAKQTPLQLAEALKDATVMHMIKSAISKRNQTVKSPAASSSSSISSNSGSNKNGTSNGQASKQASSNAPSTLVIKRIPKKGAVKKKEEDEKTKNDNVSMETTTTSTATAASPSVKAKPSTSIPTTATAKTPTSASTTAATATQPLTSSAPIVSIYPAIPGGEPPATVAYNVIPDAVPTATLPSASSSSSSSSIAANALTATTLPYVSASMLPTTTSEAIVLTSAASSTTTIPTISVPIASPLASPFASPSASLLASHSTPPSASSSSMSAASSSQPVKTEALDLTDLESLGEKWKAVAAKFSSAPYADRKKFAENIESMDEFNQNEKELEEEARAVAALETEVQTIERNIAEKIAREVARVKAVFTQKAVEKARANKEAREALKRKRAELEAKKTKLTNGEFDPEALLFLAQMSPASSSSSSTGTAATPTATSVISSASAPASSSSTSVTTTQASANDGTPSSKKLKKAD